MTSSALKPCRAGARSFPCCCCWSWSVRWSTTWWRRTARRGRRRDRKRDSTDHRALGNPGSRCAEPIAPAKQSMAPSLAARRLHLAVPDLVIGADRDRGTVLVQQRQVAERVAGLFLALVFRRPDQLGLARPGAARP